MVKRRGEVGEACESCVVPVSRHEDRGWGGGVASHLLCLLMGWHRFGGRSDGDGSVVVRAPRAQRIAERERELEARARGATRSVVSRVAGARRSPWW